MLKLAIAQLNYTVGDFAGNTTAIINCMNQAAGAGADLARIFHEPAQAVVLRLQTA